MDSFQSASSNDGCIPANDSNGTTLTVNYPPSPAAGRYAGSAGAVEVVINRNHRTFFGGLVPIPTIPVTSSAVGSI
jgi:hypothetical protein